MAKSMKLKNNHWYEPGRVNSKIYFVGYAYYPNYFEKKNFKNQIKAAFKKTKFTPYFYDEHFESETVTKKILKKIHDTAFSVFDLSDGNKNVLIEIGFALALNKRLFILRQKNSDFKIPSDIYPIERIEFGDLFDLKNKLKKAVHDVID